MAPAVQPDPLELRGHLDPPHVVPRAVVVSSRLLVVASVAGQREVRRLAGAAVRARQDVLAGGAAERHPIGAGRQTRLAVEALAHLDLPAALLSALERAIGAHDLEDRPAPALAAHRLSSRRPRAAGR